MSLPTTALLPSKDLAIRYNLELGPVQSTKRQILLIASAGEVIILFVTHPTSCSYWTRLIVLLAEIGCPINLEAALWDNELNFDGRDGGSPCALSILEDLIDCLNAAALVRFLVLRLHPRITIEEFLGTAENVDLVSQSGDPQGLTSGAIAVARNRAELRFLPPRVLASRPPQPAALRRDATRYHTVRTQHLGRPARCLPCMDRYMIVPFHVGGLKVPGPRGAAHISLTVPERCINVVTSLKIDPDRVVFHETIKLQRSV